MVKRLLIKVFDRLGLVVHKKSLTMPQEAEPKYKIGNIKFNNSHIDTLIPQLVQIGDNFVSAPGSIILAHDASLFKHTGYYRVEKTIIGNDVFLGANATVLPGVEIGHGAIIGAGSVVTKNVEPFTVVAGNPAKFMCTVDEYINKCKSKNVLYKAPDSFNKYWINQRLTANDIDEFQSKVLDEYHKSSN